VKWNVSPTIRTRLAAAARSTSSQASRAISTIASGVRVVGDRALLNDSAEERTDPGPMESEPISPELAARTASAWPGRPGRTARSPHTRRQGAQHVRTIDSVERSTQDLLAETTASDTSALEQLAVLLLGHALASLLDD